MIKSTLLAKLLTLKAAAIAVVAVSGGVAVAATTGALPNPLAPDHPGHSTTAPAHPGESSHAPGSHATPSPSLVGLCTAFLAHPMTERGKALESPAFQALVAAAGGTDGVEGFCTGLGVTPPGPGRTPTGTPPAHPGPTDHPTGEPSHPGPTDHPTGEPSHTL
jgi:hypothetical protein